MTVESKNHIQHVVVTPTKSVGIAILLILIFGPLGMLYSTVKGTFLATLLTIILFLIVGANNPLNLIFLIPVMWLVSLIWSVKAVKSYNRKLLKRAYNN